jgi:hypothetical protein
MKQKAVLCGAAGLILGAGSAFAFSPIHITQAPEPSAVVLLGAGLLALGLSMTGPRPKI